MSDLNNMEYYIKFPNSEQPSGEIALSDAEIRPVVLLFGWAGCQDKYLAKYSQIYEQRGLITLRYTAPFEYVFWKRHKMLTAGEKIKNLIVDMNLEKHPLFVHCFSNGGAFLYHGFSKACDDSLSNFNLKGVIFDSAPGARVSGIFRALYLIMDGTFLLKAPIAAILTSVFLGLWHLNVFLDYVTGKKDPSDSFKYLRNEQNRCPQHFLYSKADLMIHHQDIENFIRQRKSHGVAVSFTKFDNSAHVKHYIVYKDEYLTSICNFINRCLGKSQKNI